MSISTQFLEFRSGGVLCRGVLFCPAAAAAPGPCVVAAHGFGGTVDAGLQPFAERFAEAGFRVLAFDYRHFGRSDGEPRQLVSIRRQLADYAAAIAHARNLPGVDPARIALFGTSFSAGHVVRAAVSDGRVAAVVAQSPMMDGPATLAQMVRYAGPGIAVRIAWHGLRDLVHAATGREPHRVPIVGAPGSLAAMTTPDAEPGFRAITPPGWRNEVCARIGLAMAFYRPGRCAARLPCPILIQICARDGVAPTEAAEAAARRASPRATVVRYDTGHFDLYVGKPFERSVTDQLAFLKETLAPRNLKPETCPP
jgi:uncharacterized protein